jgi:hypothetical protein
MEDSRRKIDCVRGEKVCQTVYRRQSKDEEEEDGVYRMAYRRDGPRGEQRSRRGAMFVNMGEQRSRRGAMFVSCCGQRVQRGGRCNDDGENREDRQLPGTLSMVNRGEILLPADEDTSRRHGTSTEQVEEHFQTCDIQMSRGFVVTRGALRGRKF